MIRSAPSDFDVLLSNLPALTTHLVELVERFNQVFSDENVRTFKATLDNARLASERLPGTVRDVQEMVADVRHTAQEVQGSRGRSARHRGAFRTQISKSSYRERPGMFPTIWRRPRTAWSTSWRTTSPVSHASLNRACRNSNSCCAKAAQAARDFRDLSRSLKQNPSQLIYEPNYRGVEVAK